jgi:uncharacterized membrane protein YhhN
MIEHLFDRSDGLDTLRTSIVAVSLAVAFAYLPFVAAPPAPARAALKTAAIGLLTVLPLTYLGIGGAHTFTLSVLTAALALSALGDLLLALKDQRRFFVLGLGSFLGAHVAYLAAFLPHATLPGGSALAAIAVVLVAAAALMVVLFSRLGTLKWPVVAYFTVIMAMVGAALSIREALWILGTGAVLFALSDSLIAVRKFLNPFPGINTAVWITYCAAQFMIAAALLLLAVPAETG